MNLAVPDSLKTPKAAAIAAAIVVVLIAGYYFGLRNSGLFAIENVQIKGLSSFSGKAASEALDFEARQMTTLNLDEGRLLEAVSEFASVQSLKADADLPHKVTITVTERRPVAIARLGGAEVLLTADGLVLRNAQLGLSLPRLELKGSVVDGKVSDDNLLPALKVLGLAPERLLAKVSRIRWSKTGIVVELRNGPRIIFGQATDAALKWAAAARLLADDAVQGARYIDVRIHDRPAVGGLGAAPVTPGKKEEPAPVAPQQAAPTEATGNPQPVEPDALAPAPGGSPTTPSDPQNTNQP